MKNYAFQLQDSKDISFEFMILKHVQNKLDVLRPEIRGASRPVNLDFGIRPRGPKNKVTQAQIPPPTAHPWVGYGFLYSATKGRDTGHCSNGFR